MQSDSDHLTSMTCFQTIANNCNETIWPVYSNEIGDENSGFGGYEAPAKTQRTIALPDGWDGYICEF